MLALHCCIPGNIVSTFSAAGCCCGALLQIRGVFNGAALVFFSYIGFDSVACSAEEVKKTML
jgi:amino acid transporter